MSPLAGACPETRCVLQLRAIFPRQLQAFADFLITPISLLVWCLGFDNNAHKLTVQFLDGLDLRYICLRIH